MNGAYDRELADYRLGVYGGLGAAQGTTPNNNIQISILNFPQIDPTDRCGRSIFVVFFSLLKYFLKIMAHNILKFNMMYYSLRWEFSKPTENLNLPQSNLMAGRSNRGQNM